MKYKVKVLFHVWDVYEVEANSEDEAYELAEEMAGDKSLNEMNNEFEGCTILGKDDDTEDDPLEGCSDVFRKGIKYVMENMDEDDKAILRAEVNKCYKQHIIPSESVVDDSKIIDLLEEYGDDHNMPEGWYLDEYDAGGTLPLL